MKAFQTKTGHSVIVDEDTWLRLGKFEWTTYADSKSGKPYVGRFVYEAGKTEYLARVITNAPEGVVVRFKNGDPLDCRKSNLQMLPMVRHRKTIVTPADDVVVVRGHWRNGRWYDETLRKRGKPKPLAAKKRPDARTARERSLKANDARWAAHRAEKTLRKLNEANALARGLFRLALWVAGG